MLLFFVFQFTLLETTDTAIANKRLDGHGILGSQGEPGSVSIKKYNALFSLWN